MAEVQTRLTVLGYWLGSVDGIFGNNTYHAVVAFQKAAGLELTGIVDTTTRSALSSGSLPTPQSSAGRVVEVDLSRQVLLLVDDGDLEWVLDTSTGRRGFDTPPGEYVLFDEIDAANVDGAYRPKYFLEAGHLAIHGYRNVPPYPYSHGCVRVTKAAMDWLWSSGLIPLGTPVVIYEGTG